MEHDALEALIKRLRREPLWQPGSDTQAVDYRGASLKRLLPHREPFLLLDAVTALDLRQEAIAGRRCIDPADPVLDGHFPGSPVYPGVLQLETAGQLGVCLLGFRERGSGELPPAGELLDVRVISVERAAFLAAVHPGDELTVLARVLEADTTAALCAGQLLRGDQVCALAAMEVYIAG